LVSRSQHPADLQPGYELRLAQGKNGFNAKKVVQIYLTHMYIKTTDLDVGGGLHQWRYGCISKP
jgi:hypothetical protein